MDDLFIYLLLISNYNDVFPSARLSAAKELQGEGGVQTSDQRR